MFMTLFVPPVKTTTIRLAFHFPIHLSALKTRKFSQTSLWQYNVIQYGSSIIMVARKRNHFCEEIPIFFKSFWYYKFHSFYLCSAQMIIELMKPEKNLVIVVTVVVSTYPLPQLINMSFYV